jgi:hypothetical protein
MSVSSGGLDTYGVRGSAGGLVQNLADWGPLCVCVRRGRYIGVTIYLAQKCRIRGNWADLALRGAIWGASWRSRGRPLKWTRRTSIQHEGARPVDDAKCNDWRCKMQHREAPFAHSPILVLAYHYSRARPHTPHPALSPPCFDPTIPLNRPRIDSKRFFRPPGIIPLTSPENRGTIDLS